MRISDWSADVCSSDLVLLEQLGCQAGRLEFAQMLLAEAFVRRQQDNPVQFAAPAVFVEIELILQDVGMRQQRLAAAGGAPIGDLVDQIGRASCRERGCRYV